MRRDIEDCNSNLIPIVRSYPRRAPPSPLLLLMRVSCSITISGWCAVLQCGRVIPEKTLKKNVPFPEHSECMERMVVLLATGKNLVVLGHYRFSVFWTGMSVLGARAGLGGFGQCGEPAGVPNTTNPQHHIPVLCEPPSPHPSTHPAPPHPPIPGWATSPAHPAPHLTPPPGRTGMDEPAAPHPLKKNFPRILGMHGAYGRPSRHREKSCGALLGRFGKDGDVGVGGGQITRWSGRFEKGAEE